MQSSTQNIWVAQRDRGKDTMAIVKSEAPCADNARNNTARNRPSKACQPAKSTLGNFHAIPVFSLMSYLAFQSFLAVKKQLADLHAGQTNGGGPFLLVLRTNESAQALRGRVVEESLQDSLMACPLCNQYAAEPIQFTYVDMAICHTHPLKICVAWQELRVFDQRNSLQHLCQGMAMYLEWGWWQTITDRNPASFGGVRWMICRDRSMSRNLTKSHSLHSTPRGIYFSKSATDRFQVAEL